MAKAAAFQATYSDWKLIKTRSTVQIVFEVPVEQAKLAYEVLGGMPTPAAEVWCGIARLQAPLAKEVIEKPRPPAASAPHTGGAHRSWHEMSAAQQTGILCRENSFWNYLEEVGYCDRGEIVDADFCANVVRKLCLVETRSDIDKSKTSKEIWRDIAAGYRAYMREPEVVPV